MRSETLIAAFVVGMMLCSAFMVYGIGPGAPNLEASVIGDDVLAEYSMPSSDHAYPGVILAAPVSRYRQDDIAVLMTGRNGLQDSDPSMVQGLVDHLSAELDNIGSDSKVSMIEERSLSSYLGTGNGTLIIASALDPSLAQEVSEWVWNGGVLVSIGPLSIPFNGQDNLTIGYVPFDHDHAISEGPGSEGPGLRMVAPPFGLLSSDVESCQGTVLGLTDDDQNVTTMAAIPYGQGAVLAMGGPIKEPFRASMEDVFAWDLARCLEAGLQWAVGPLSYEPLTVPSSGLHGTSTFKGEGEAMSIAIYSLDDAHSLFSCVRVSL